MGTARILICPLDWGLGHAARCVPVIRALIDKDCTPIIAADNGPLELLQKEFPDVELIQFPGVQVSYPNGHESMLWSMLKQTPALLKGISEETKFIEKTVEDLGIDYVISDNRFGAYAKKVPSVYITHQINIQTGNKITDALARQQHAYYMKNFAAVWIPDFLGKNSIAGKLSQGKIPSHAHYIGPLSRFSLLPAKEKKYDVAFILSGPEPQRSILEEIILKQTEKFPDKKFLLIRGKNEALSHLSKNIDIAPLADASTVLEAYSISEKIVCRSGYTSVMELISINRNAWLIPTPGQTEQEYLANHLSGKFGFTSVSQKDFDLKKIMESKTETTSDHVKNITSEALSTAIENLIQTKKANP